jgi:hypothetical protein
VELKRTKNISGHSVSIMKIEPDTSEIQGRSVIDRVVGIVVVIINNIHPLHFIIV